MKAISKTAEPASLTAHRQTPHCDYDNFTDKAELRASLFAEQQGICCYCMQRIHNDSAKMKVEHWHCQSRYPNEQLVYRNLLGACLGGQGQPIHLQHCDTRKGDSDLLWNPADSVHHIETRIRYDPDGTIRSDDPVFDAQLNDVLNLNLPLFKTNRKGVLSAVLKWWKDQRDKAQGPVPKKLIEREIRNRLSRTRDLQPYSTVAVWWLSKKL
jgi:uncharacterized protein (TIGR02646 family)